MVKWLSYAVIDAIFRASLRSFGAPAGVAREFEIGPGSCSTEAIKFQTTSLPFIVVFGPNGEGSDTIGDFIASNRKVSRYGQGSYYWRRPLRCSGRG
jgi:hypothetical protein